MAQKRPEFTTLEQNKKTKFMIGGLDLAPAKVFGWLLNKKLKLDFGNPENLTSEERLSRLLHNPKASKPPSDNTCIFEHFVVMGPKPHTDDLEPQIIYQFPADVPIPVPGLPAFCFPTGITTKKLDTTKYTESRLLELMYSQDHLDRPENYYVFQLTTEDERNLYGVCVIKDEIINGKVIEKWDTKEVPSYSDLVASSHDGDHLIFTPRCYCFLTRLPFFNLHFSVINDILALEYSGNTTVDLRSKNLGIEDYEGDFGGNKATYILKNYQRLEVPPATSTASKPITFRSVLELPPISFRRPPKEDEEADMLCEYALPIAIQLITKENFFAILSCILTERKVVFYCPNLRVLSAVVLAWIVLIRPFKYPHPFIPMLPQNLYEMLAAPVPFIIGITSLPPKGEIAPEVVIVDVVKDKVRLSEPALQLPQWKELEMKIRVLGKEIMKEMPAERKDIMYKTSPTVHKIAEEFSTVLHSHFKSLFTDFSKHCIRDLTDNESPITVFLKESFLSATPKADLPFFKAFLQTQMFLQYSDVRLREADRKIMMKGST